MSAGFLSNSGNWCTACNGTFESAGQVISLFKSDIRFNDIPREAILHIETKETPIDWTNEAHLKLASQKVSKDVTRVAEIDERIKSGGLYDQMIATYIQSITDKRQQDKRHLSALKNHYSGDMSRAVEIVNGRWQRTRKTLG